MAPIPRIYRDNWLTLYRINRVSYRGLLGTAETIIEMDEQMHRVEAYLGDMGSKCNTRLLEKKGMNLRAWNGEVSAAGA